MKVFIHKISPENVFLGVCLLNILIMFCILLNSYGAALEIMSYGESNFGDFWFHIDKVLYADSIYGNSSDANAIFPPLAYCFLKLFATLIMNRAYNIDIPVRISGYGILCLVIYLTLFILLFVFVIQYIYKSESCIKQKLLPFIFIFSYPFLGCAIERGNLVLYAMLFLMLGLALGGANSRFLQEVALVLIALAASFKLYPAIFGLLWIVDKKYKEAIRLIIYGLTTFFVPFIFLGESIGDYFFTFSLYLGKNVYSKTSLLGNCIMLFGEQGRYIGFVLIICWLLWIIYYLFSESITWKTIALLMSTQTILLAESYIYTFVFISIPLCFFLNSLLKKKRYFIKDYIYAVLFALTFTCPPLLNVMSGVMVGLYVSWLAILLLISLEKVFKIVHTKINL